MDAGSQSVASLSMTLRLAMAPSLPRFSYVLNMTWLVCGVSLAMSEARLFHIHHNRKLLFRLKVRSAVDFTIL